MSNKVNSSSVSAAVLAGLRACDTPVVSDATAKVLGRHLDLYTDQTMRWMIPGLKPFIGYAVTVEVTTNDEDSPAVSFGGHYRNMAAAGGPAVAVFKDIDSRPGRGASFGEGMSLLHRNFGGVGLLVDGTVRDLEGMRARKFPALAWGVVPGHGRFKPIRLNVPVSVGGLRIHPGDLLLADLNGCVKIPVDRAAEVLKEARAIMRSEKQLFVHFQSKGLPFLKKLMNWE